MFSIFFAIWAFLGIGLFLFYTFNHNVDLKRKCHPWIVSGVGIIFGSFIISTGAPLQVLMFMVPMIVLITVLNIKMMKFCDECGRTIYNQNWFVKMSYCPKCGKELNDKESKL